MASTLVDVEKVYEQNQDLKKQDVDNLTQWITTQPHLPKVTELQVIHFLHSCYYSSEVTKQAIDSFFTIRTHVPELFLNIDPRSADHQNALRVYLIKIMPGTTPEGYKVIYCDLNDRDPKNYSLTDQMRVFDMAYLLWLNQNEKLAEGFVFVANVINMNLAFFAKMNLSVIRKFAVYLQEAMPIRLKAIHFINVGPLMDKVLNLLKPFLKKEMFESIHLHTDYTKTLYNYISKENMPRDFGGNGPTCKELAEQHRKEQTSNYEFFLKLDNQLVKESKRPEPSKLTNELFGIEGTFKKLDID